MKYLMPVSVFLLMISVGMGLSGRAQAAEFQRMSVSKLFRLFVATFLIPPAVAWCLAHLFSLASAEAAGLFLVAVAPGAPLVTRNIAKRGFDANLAATYQVCGALLIPVMVPLLCYLVALTYDVKLFIPPGPLLAQILNQICLPLAVGMFLVQTMPGFARKIGRTCNVAGNIGLNIGILGALYVMREQLARITFLVAVAAILIAVSALLGVRLLLRTTPQREHTLALTNVNRHVGLAMLIAGQHFPKFNIVPAVAAYALVAAVVMALYSKFAQAPKQMAATA